MTYLWIALGGGAGLYILWRIFIIWLNVSTPVKIKGRSYLYAQLKRIGVETEAVSTEIVDAAVQLAELGAKHQVSGKINYKVFCPALDEYAKVIRDKLRNVPLSPDAERSWKAIQKGAMQGKPRPGPSESRR
jgi:hypothetical protein